MSVAEMIAVLDFLFSSAERIAEKVDAAKKEGAILTPEQEAVLAKVQRERAAVGLPPRG